MIYLTQLIYIKEEQEDVFNKFESVAIPIIAKYNGRLLLRIRTSDDDIITKSIDTPHEIHLVEFQSESDFENFKSDKDRNKFLHLKERSIKSMLLIKGIQI